MKLWKKVYLFALIITTLCINIGFLGIVYFTYSQMLQAEKERCEAEYVIMRQSISADIAQMEKSISLNQQYFERYINVYNSYYGEDTQLIGKYGNEVLTQDESYATLPEEDGLFVYEEKQTTIYVMQTLDDNHPNYRIIMRRTLGDFDKMWDTLQPLYIAGGILLSLGVSFLLAAVVRMVLKPMDELESAAKQVQAENWSTRVQIKGKHELAQLGKQFNAMAGAVEENITKLEQQSEQKQQLINNLAHEMNTPITSIQGFADYMRISELSKEEQQECLGFIIGESKRLKEISSTLLSMASMQEDTEVLQEVFSLKNLCNKLEKIYRKRFDEKQIALTMNCEVEEMKGNEVLIESLLRNLITNAGHAVSEKEEGQIEVRAFSTDDKIKIEVSDNGCGIEAAHLEQIFEPFYRVDKARSRENGGSGLGLPFCKRIVALHKGSIEVESKSGVGTKLVLTFTV
ncbi:MAG: HAMP domain-containing histidine kinase [Agathobacter sp.]|nr:HAMP domain-containing histidine kinase [Agathobacter sp.]